MPLVEFFTEDPGLEILVSHTKINLIEKLALGVRFAAGRGTVGYVAAVVDDRGAAAIPYQLTSPRDLETLFGGFKSWLGDAVPAGNEGTLAGGTYGDRGAASGYLGNGYAMAKGLDAPIVVLQVPDLAVKDDSIEASPAGVDVLVKFTRATAAYGAYQLPAGTRISDGDLSTPYVLATLEAVSWGETETGDKTVRCRQASPASTTPVAVNLVDTFVDSPDDSNVTIATTATTVPEAIDAAELVARYEDALTHLLDNAPGRLVELVVTDRTESGVGDAVGDHCFDASSQGYFRLGVIAPPLGTTATDARAAAGNGVARTTLQRSYVSYCHPAWSRQFRTDSDNLNAAANWVADMASHVAFAFLAAQRRPEENPARPHPILTSYKITGVEPLAAGQPDRKAHEQAGITQPILDLDFGTQQPVATYHASPMADAVLKFATRRMAFWLYRQLVSLAAPYHKAFASETNRAGLLSAIDGFLERLKNDERIADYVPAQGDWDAVNSQFTVSVAIEEVGNMDVITLRPTFGPSAVADSDVAA